MLDNSIRILNVRWSGWLLNIILDVFALFRDKISSKLLWYPTIEIFLPSIFGDEKILIKTWTVELFKKNIVTVSNILIELAKYINKNFYITETGNLLIDIEKVLNHCNEYWMLFNEYWIIILIRNYYKCCLVIKFMNTKTIRSLKLIC